MEATLVYLIVPAALFYLGARAKITQPIWQRWDNTRFGDFLSCSACSGLWYGVIVALIGYGLGWHLFGAHAWWTVPTVAACSIVTTPIVAAAHERALHQLSYGQSMPITTIVADHDISR